MTQVWPQHRDNNCTTMIDIPSDKESVQIPCRNLSNAFEDLYVASPKCETTTPGAKNASGNGEEKVLTTISPTGVADIHRITQNIEVGGEIGGRMTADSMIPSKAGSIESTDSFFAANLHPDLKLDLSQGILNRVAIYGVIHDINKEASSMASNDDLCFSNVEEIEEKHSPLVVEVNGPPSESKTVAASSMARMALIDDERWILSAIEARGSDECRSDQICPPTFPQAMGEREYENPLTSLSNGSRTQLWKPSRSWWEAKSGKNPWIEPKSHNKRWRYLWPLIHYHKFLAKCIKKLKRNGVDVKISFSPVAAFLREEICAISDHLAAVSLFDSEVWMRCLETFKGWTDTSPKSENCLREHVSKLKLRPLNEPGDIDSPLLRNQIEIQFLRAMVASRKQMNSGDSCAKRKASKAKNRLNNQNSSFQYQKATKAINQYSPLGGRRPRLGYHYQRCDQGYVGISQYAYGEDSFSAQSSFAGNALGHFSGHSNLPPIYNYYPPTPQNSYLGHPQAAGMQDHNVGEHPMYHLNDVYNTDQPALFTHGWVDHSFIDPTTGYALHTDMQGYHFKQAMSSSHQEYPSNFSNLDQKGIFGYECPTIEPCLGGHTPLKYDPNNAPSSPYWSHLDRATLSMGVATPNTNPPATPHRQESSVKNDNDNCSVDVPPADVQTNSAVFVGNPQPLLLHQTQHCGYGPYVPPSPATQFMMSPQVNFAYGHNCDFSPYRTNLHTNNDAKNAPGENIKQSEEKCIFSTEKTVCSASLCEQKLPSDDNRNSPSTVQTVIDSEGLLEIE